MEIRPIQQQESLAFLRFLCDIFDLEFERARPAYFSDPFFDLNRKWAICEGTRLVSILTTVPLTFGWGRGIGIAGVATDPAARGKGYAGELLKHVLREARNQGEGAAYLFARDARLYERMGFEIVEKVVRGTIAAPACNGRRRALPLSEVRPIYEAWAVRSPARIRRDDRRWRHWNWGAYKSCTRVAGGYTCVEGCTVRELLADHRPSDWRLPGSCEWLGLESMARHAGLDLRDVQFELYLMACRSPMAPQMFLTDQF